MLPPEALVASAQVKPVPLPPVAEKVRLPRGATVAGLGAMVIVGTVGVGLDELPPQLIRIAPTTTTSHFKAIRMGIPSTTVLLKMNTREVTRTILDVCPSMPR